MDITKFNDNQLVQLLGTLPDVKDVRDFKLKFKGSNPLLVIHNEEVILPINSPSDTNYFFDLRTKMPVIYDQGSYPYCAAYSVSAGLDYYNNQDVGEFVRFAEPWIYEESRRVGNISSSTAGTSLRNVLKVIHTIGTLPRREWSEVLRKPKKKDKLLQEILINYKIQSYAGVDPKNAKEIKKALRTFGPVYCGLNIYSSWREVGVIGKLPKNRGDRLGGHAMVVVGYNDKVSSFIVRNSWGDWGDSGHCYIPYDYFSEEVFSCWTAVDLRGSKDLYDPTAWEKFRDSNIPTALKKAFGIPFKG